MLKKTAIGAAFYLVAAQGASACVTYDGLSDTFTNTCGTDVYVEYRTVGGGCYADKRGSFPMKPNETRVDPKLSEPCGSTTNWRVDWAWCDLADWKSGSCKPKF